MGAKIAVLPPRELPNHTPRPQHLLFLNSKFAESQYPWNAIPGWKRVRLRLASATIVPSQTTENAISTTYQQSKKRNEVYWRRLTEIHLAVPELAMESTLQLKDSIDRACQDSKRSKKKSFVKSATKPSSSRNLATHHQETP